MSFLSNFFPLLSYLTLLCLIRHDVNDGRRSTAGSKQIQLIERLQGCFGHPNGAGVQLWQTMVGFVTTLPDTIVLETNIQIRPAMWALTVVFHFINSLTLGRCSCNLKSVICNLISSNKCHEHFLWNCPQMNTTKHFVQVFTSWLCLIIMINLKWYERKHNDDLVHEFRNFSTSGMELMPSCTKPAMRTDNQ